MNVRWAIAASLALALVGCDSGQPRTIHGQINVSDYGVGAPVVLVESASHSTYVARVSATGRFSIAVPSGQSYRLTLANGTTTGPLALVSRILWSKKGQNFVWATVGKGSTIQLGLIRPVGASATAAGSAYTGASEGENDDSQCDEDDDSQGDEQGPAGSGASCQPAMQPPSNPPLCMAGAMGSSSGDRDDDCDEDNQDHGDDDRDGNGGACGDGGTVSSGNDDNQGDDNAQGNENEDDNDGNGHGCVKHVPSCPPATPPGGGTTPPGGGATPPSDSPDLGGAGPVA
jgi:hypothetical protein